MGDSSRVEEVVGLDVSDKWTQFCVLSRSTGHRQEEGRFRTTPEAVQKWLSGRCRSRVVLEVGAHSPWMSRCLEGAGQEVLVANAGKVALIYKNSRKNDRVDAESLARLGRLDPHLLHPLRHRSASAQADLAIVKSREILVQARTQCINHVRGVVKAVGARLPSCSAEAFAKRAGEQIPGPLARALAPVVELVASLTRQIRGYDKQLEHLAATKYPQTQSAASATGSRTDHVVGLRARDRRPRAFCQESPGRTVPGAGASDR